jgi:hypothetical protein
MSYGWTVSGYEQKFLQYGYASEWVKELGTFQSTVIVSAYHLMMTTQNDIVMPSGNASVEIYFNNILTFSHSMTKITSRCFWFDMTNISYDIVPGSIYWNYVASPTTPVKVKIKWPVMTSSPGWTNFVAAIDSQIGRHTGAV